MWGRPDSSPAGAHHLAGAGHAGLLGLDLAHHLKAITGALDIKGHSGRAMPDAKNDKPKAVEFCEPLAVR